MTHAQIQQNSPEWLEAKLSTIGGSEIYNLVIEYTTEEERKKYLPNFEVETSFGSIMQTAIKFLYKITPDDFDEVNREYGHAMEIPMIHFFNQRFKNIATAEYTRDFIIHEKYKSISCSPDGYVELHKDAQEFGNENSIIEKSSGLGLLELKTIRHADAWNQEAKMQYLFQCNWNAWVCGLKWYCIFLSYAKDYENESDFKKGQRTALANMEQYDKIYQQIDFAEYFYKLNPAVINLCKLAFNRFAEKIKEARTLDYNKMWTIFNFSKNAKTFLSEKKLLSRIESNEIKSQFGDKIASDAENNMMVERLKNNKQIKDLESRNIEIDGYFTKSILNHTAITSSYDIFELKCQPTEKGIKFSPTLANKKLLDILKN